MVAGVGCFFLSLHQDFRSTTICCKSMVIQYNDNNSDVGGNDVDDHNNINKKKHQTTNHSNNNNNNNAIYIEPPCIQMKCARAAHKHFQMNSTTIEMAKKKICAAAALFSVTMRYSVHTVHKTYIHTCICRRKMCTKTKCARACNIFNEKNEHSN